MIEVLESHNLTRFLELLETAGMMEELSGLNDVTVFAPSNKAIDDLPSGVLDEIIVRFTLFFFLTILGFHVQTELPLP